MNYLFSTPWNKGDLFCRRKHEWQGTHFEILPVCCIKPTLCQCTPGAAQGGVIPHLQCVLKKDQMPLIWKMKKLTKGDWAVSNLLASKQAYHLLLA